MIGLIAAEWLKYRRTFLRRLVILAPAGIGMLHVFLTRFSSLPPTWSVLLAAMLNWWVVLAMPVGAALLAALAEAQEDRSNGWRALRTRAVAPARLFVAKAVVLAIATLLSSVTLLLAILVEGLLTCQGPVPIGALIAGTLLPWLLSLPILALQLSIAMGTNFAVSVMVGVAGLIAGIAAAARTAWIAVPWAWPIRVLGPILGVHPNGTFLPADSPLRDLAVIPSAIGAALVSALVVTAIGAIWMGRREVK